MKLWKKVTYVALVLMSVFAIGSTHSAQAAPAKRPARSWSSVVEIANYAEVSINGYWAAAFRNANIQYDPPHAFFGYIRPVQIKCGPTQLNNAQFCRLDHTITYDINFFNDQWQSYGDFAPVAIIAHEWGHLVQADLNLTNQPYAELQADCLAGSYAQYAAQTGLLDPGDLDEATESLFDNGDPSLPWFAPNTHGRPEERVQAFTMGLRNGLGSCFQVYH